MSIGPSLPWHFDIRFQLFSDLEPGAGIIIPDSGYNFLLFENFALARWPFEVFSFPSFVSHQFLEFQPLCLARLHSLAIKILILSYSAVCVRIIRAIFLFWALDIDVFTYRTMAIELKTSAI